MVEKTVTCYFCFESFKVYLESGDQFNGPVTEIYDCEVCCNPNQIVYQVDGEQITITEVSGGNE
ncbi:MAG: CPXCG motif-containing cysteine-rich protein [bacterium]|nr:CPXCG motif-containing cysteine-rich protein [bacterium]